jgi:uncharacterized membrane protein (DUF106 family)
MLEISVAITIAAIAYVLLSVFLQRRLVNMKRVYEVQEIIKRKTKELTDMGKAGADQAALAAKQKEITGLLSESMKSQLKPMFVVLPLFLVLYYLVLPAVFPPPLSVSLFSMTLDYRAYFILVSFVLGFVLSTALMVRDKSRASKAAKIEAQANAEANA